MDNDGVYGSNSTGTWTGLIGMAYRDEVDLCLADFRTSIARAAVVEFTPPLMQFRSGFELYHKIRHFYLAP